MHRRQAMRRVHRLLVGLMVLVAVAALATSTALVVLWTGHPHGAIFLPYVLLSWIVLHHLIRASNELVLERAGRARRSG